MPLYQPVLYTILQLVVLAALGYVLKRFLHWPAEFFKQLSRFLVTYALPLYLFAGIAEMKTGELSSARLFPLYALLIVLVALACSWLLFGLFRFRGIEKRAGIAFSSFGNGAYIPLTVIAIFQLTAPHLAKRLGGSSPSLYVGAYLLVFSPILWSAGKVLLTHRGQKIRPWQLISPPFIGVAAGFIVVLVGLGPVVMNKQLPLYPIFRALDLLGQVTFPLILVCLGAMIADLRFGSTIRPEMVRMGVLVSAIRFLLLPSIFFALYFLAFRHWGMDAAQLWVLFLEMSAPPATNFSVMAGSAGVNEHNTAFTLLLSYLVYVVMLPLELYLFLNLPGVLPGVAI